MSAFLIGEYLKTNFSFHMNISQVTTLNFGLMKMAQ
jgi:hypothetical protein